ncbi:MAG TPA: hydrogenase maturation nickel metallochaperone HypA [Phycisphaerae bacterium]|nr:hydrogenase maturation nickel metallochaperone HypA [Phycisphaerae bacterium]
MHELSLARHLVELAADEARRAGAARVRRVRCRIGLLRQVDDLLMREAFDLAARSTLCEAAELEIEHTLMRGRCGCCGIVFAMADWHATCPQCHAEAERLLGGDELDLVQLEVETPDDHDHPDCA